MHKLHHIRWWVIVKPFSAIFIVLPRISFTGDGKTDSCQVESLSVASPDLHHCDAASRFAWYQMSEHNTVVPLAVENAVVGVAMLLRLSYLEPTDLRSLIKRRIGNHP